MRRSSFWSIAPRHAMMRATVVLCLSLLAAGSGWAQEAEPKWSQLSPSERSALQPLQAQWADIDTLRKQKWRQIAQRYPHLPIDQQARVRTRMAEWAKLTVAERNAARMRFQQATDLPAAERQARWDAYQALSAEQRRALADRAQSRTQQQPASATNKSAKAPKTLDQVQPKSNLVGTAVPATSRPVAPGTVQASVGASTRPITQRPMPPKHQQAGMPKIAATPQFVDRSTLLPRDPQAASVEPARASQ